MSRFSSPSFRARFSANRPGLVPPPGATSGFLRHDGSWAEGSGGGYIDGEVATYADLPVTAGIPTVNSAYLVREASGLWMVNRKPAGIYVRMANAGALADWTYAGTFPDLFSDANFSLYDDGDSSKELGFSLAGITTGTKRILTPQNKNYTIADHADAIYESILIPLSDETTAITSGTAKLTIPYWPFNFAHSVIPVLMAKTAPTGSGLTVDINVNGSSTLSTKLTLDAGETDSTTAAAAAVLSTSAIAKGSVVTFDFDSVGLTVAGAGLKVFFEGTRTP